MRPLGEIQQAVLDAMRNRHNGTWHEGAGWLWDTISGTRRIMESLAKRGLLNVREEKLVGRHNTLVRRIYSIKEH